jgi:3-deoxy-manno-octulosonate cytidylyltransferase (CMP-KDO synthetase)
MAKAAIIIPARWGATRFPGKPLHVISGKPLIQHVWERCQRAKSVGRVIVATDDMRIAEAAFGFGAEVALTSKRHPSGTDRAAEVAANLRNVGIIVNVQGDEPLLDPRLVDRLIAALVSRVDCEMSTAGCPLDDADVGNPNCVKVVCDVDGRALYFSRSPIPADRDGEVRPVRWRHLGIYAYRRKFLSDFVRWRPTPLELSEKLEQLRALEHGARILVVKTKRSGPGVDTPGDVALVEREMKLRGQR